MFTVALAVILLNGIDSGGLNFLGLHLNLPFEINAWPMHKIFAVDAVTYFLAFVLILLLNINPLNQTKNKAEYNRKNNSRFHVFKKQSASTFIRHLNLIRIYCHFSRGLFALTAVRC